jgi:hypothetical protein
MAQMNSKTARSNKERVASTFEPPRGAGEFARKRFQAVRFIAEENLARMEQLLKQNPRLGASCEEWNSHAYRDPHTINAITIRGMRYKLRQTLPACEPSAAGKLRRHHITLVQPPVRFGLTTNLVGKTDLAYQYTRESGSISRRCR